MILRLEDVSKRYKQGALEVPALSHVNFEMNEGDYTAVMGPSGSGKSTLMNLIGCLDQATDGEIYLDGRPLCRCSDDELAEIRLNKIGFIFSAASL